MHHLRDETRRRKRGAALSVVLVGFLALGQLCGCADVSDFDEPYMQEIFTGSLIIEPSVKGISAGARSVAVMAIKGNASGETVMINGIPDTDPFPLIPESTWEDEKALIPPKFKKLLRATHIAGFVADVVDKHTIEVSGVGSWGPGAKELKVRVSGGTMVRTGPRLATTEPIVVQISAGALKDMLPSPEFHKSIVSIKDQISLAKMDNSAMIDLYQIEFVGELLSFL